VKLHARTRGLLAWALWLASFGCCAAGLLVALALVRPLTLGILAQGAAFALAFPLGFATVGLLLTLRRPANPIGWLYAGAGLAWSWDLPFGPWIERLVRDTARCRRWRRSCPWWRSSAGHRRSRWGSPCRRCCCPTGGCARAAGAWWWPPPPPAPRPRWSGWW
jgi:hypothetical protein